MILTLAPAAAGSYPGNLVTVSEGGAPEARQTLDLHAGSEEPPFGVSSFLFESLDEAGRPSTAAEAPPNVLTAGLDFNSAYSTAPGLKTADPLSSTPEPYRRRTTGRTRCNPQAAAQCPEYLLAQNLDGVNCPDSSIVGMVYFSGSSPNYAFSLHEESATVSPLFNVTPEHGVPAEFAFTYSGFAAFIYAHLAHTCPATSCARACPQSRRRRRSKARSSRSSEIPAAKTEAPRLPCRSSATGTPAACATGHSATATVGSWAQLLGAPGVSAAVPRPSAMGNRSLSSHLRSIDHDDPVDDSK